MTAATEDKVIEEGTAREALLEIEKVERALDDAYELIATSLHLADRKAVEAYIKTRRDLVKEYLQTQGPRETLTEGELGTRANITINYHRPTYDLVTAAQTENGPADLAEAAKAGMLVLDNGMLEKFRGSAGAAWADRLFRVRVPGGIKSVSLHIERGAK